MSPHYYRRSLDWWMMNKFTQSPIRARDIDVKIFSLIWLSYFKIQFIVHVWNKVKMIEWKFVLDFFFQSKLSRQKSKFNFDNFFSLKFKTGKKTIFGKFKTEKKMFWHENSKRFLRIFFPIIWIFASKNVKIEFCSLKSKKIQQVKTKLSGLS